MNIIYGIITLLVLAIMVAFPFLLAYFIYRLIKGKNQQTEKTQQIKAKTANSEAAFQRWKAEREKQTKEP